MKTTGDRTFVSRQFTREIDAELVEIRKVLLEQDGPGFKRLHVRSKLREPLNGVRLTLGEVRVRSAASSWSGWSWVAGSSSTASLCHFRAARLTVEWRMDWS
jgi:hypothetical protein